jgi:hypothetical protein
MQAAVTNLRTPTPLIIQQKPKIFLCKKIDLVESPQTNLQPKPAAETETAVSAKTFH